MTVDEFESDVFAVAAASAICGIPVIRSLMPVSINIRIPMTIDGFIDIYYNESTGTTAYALIQNEQRVFGADNTGGWHVHPFNNPAGHNPMPGVISLAEFVEQIEQHHTQS
jgi:hypothetical protein